MKRNDARCERARRVLLVEDEPSMRDCLTDFLKFKGFEVDPATGCLDGFLEAMKHSHDCLVLDLTFPDMNGVFLFNQLKRVNQELAGRTIFITGLDERHPVHRRALDTGVPILAKPFAFSRLYDILNSYCNR
jgi:two-component system OmpR family response regulator